MKKSVTILKLTMTIIVASFVGLYSHAADKPAGAKIVSFSPQPTKENLPVPTVNQARVTFSAPMVAVSAPDQNVDIFIVKCEGGVKSGSARWLNETTWSYDFQTDSDGNFIPGGTVCSFDLKPGVKTLAGKAITGKTNYSFKVDGPNIIALRVGDDYSDVPSIEEEQAFVLKLDSHVSVESVLNNVYLSVEGLPSAVGVRVLEDGELKNKVIYDSFYDSEPSNKPYLVLMPRQSLPAEAKVTLVWTGVKDAKTNMSRQTAQKFNYKVRSGLSAMLVCSRENAKADCNPLVALEIQFSEDVQWNQAKQIKLVNAKTGKTISAVDLAEEGEAVPQYTRTVTFAAPFAESAVYKVEFPTTVLDVAGRTLKDFFNFKNSKGNPTIATADLPPLAKFNGKFGVIESKETVDLGNGLTGVLLPSTLRNLEAKAITRFLSSEGKSAQVNASTLGLGYSDFKKIVRWMKDIDGRQEYTQYQGKYDDRANSIFNPENAPQSKLKTVEVPLKNGGNSFEMVGIPLPGKGFYVAELESRILGNSLFGEDRSMYVPTSVMVTDLAIHFKWGRKSSLVWVTSLDTGLPVAGSKVALHNCSGDVLAEGTTDANGLWKLNESIRSKYVSNCDNDFPPVLRPDSEFFNYRSSKYSSGYFVTAQKGDEFSFTHTSWNDGIDPWNFGLNYNQVRDPSEPYNSSEDQRVAHTVLDRALFRAGETVSMKHVIRELTVDGFGPVDKKNLPNNLVIIHDGSGDTYDVDVAFSDLVNYSAESSWVIPKGAKLGSYSAQLQDKSGNTYAPVHFNVEEYKVPLMKGIIKLQDSPIVKQPTSDAQVVVSYLNGGPASSQQVTYRYHTYPNTQIELKGFKDYNFVSAPVKEGTRQGYDEQKEVAPISQTLNLDQQGSATVRMTDLNKFEVPQELIAELEFRDANGETQTVSRSTPLWLSSHVVGFKQARTWGLKRNFDVKLAVASIKGNAVPNSKVSLSFFNVKTYSHRVRLVGGFYGYEHRTVTEAVGSDKVTYTCQNGGATDAKGKLSCAINSKLSGTLVVQAEITDPNGYTSIANQTYSLTGRDNGNFMVQNSDRIDLVPAKEFYNPGETASFQVQMPFAKAQALVAIEREGIIETRVVEITKENPVIEVPILKSYSPNIFVSALLVRGRIKAGGEVPTQYVDLSKPSFRFGLAQVKVNWDANRLDVNVSSNKEVYKPQEEVTVNVKVKPTLAQSELKGGEVAIAVVDQGLLEMKPNNTWDLLSSMLVQRPYEVTTYTAQMQVVGKRHYGLKAAPHGGGGGQQTTRELFDTLLYWSGKVKLDANGNAQVKFKTNDSLTQFKVVAVAQSGLDLYGKGEASFNTNQDLIMVSGLPLVSRTGDQLNNEFNMRNTTTRNVNVSVGGTVTFSMPNGKVQVAEIPKQNVQIAAQQSKAVNLGVVEVPVGASKAVYEVAATDGSSGVSDRIKISQSVLPSVPVRAQMSSLKQVDADFSPVDVSLPQGALPGLGGVKVSLMPNLAQNLTTVSDYMKQYPYQDIESRLSRAVVLNSKEEWNKAISDLPAYLDEQGYVKYYMSLSKGNLALTAYVVSIAQKSQLGLSDELKLKLGGALATFITGEQRAPSKMDKVGRLLQQLAAMEALTSLSPEEVTWEQVEALPQLEGSELTQFPVTGVLNWISVLNRVPSPNNSSAEFQKTLEESVRARLTQNSNSMWFSSPGPTAYWMMASADSNMGRLISTLLESNGTTQTWSKEIPLLVRGMIGLQQRGSWDLTTANAWNMLALKDYSKAYEKDPVDGQTEVVLAAQKQTQYWAAKKSGETYMFNWPESGADKVSVNHKGEGKPWALISAMAALPVTQARSAGFYVTKDVQPIRQATPGMYSRGDIYEVKLKVKSNAEVMQVALMDPVPSGAKILGSGLQNQNSSMDDGGPSSGGIWPDYQELAAEGYRAFYSYVPNSEFEVVYRIQLNSTGKFKLPATRIEAIYLPEMFGEMPNSDWEIK